MRGFYLFEQRKLDGHFITNDYVAEKIIIETDSFYQASMILQSITMDYSTPGEKRFYTRPSQYAIDLETIMEYIDKGSTVIIYHKQGRQPLIVD